MVHNIWYYNFSSQPEENMLLIFQTIGSKVSLPDSDIKITDNPSICSVSTIPDFYKT